MRLGLIIISILLLSVSLLAQTGEIHYYSHKDYSGGINVQSDSSSLAANQSLILENLVFDRLGSLQKRYGLKYWNNVQFPIGDTIKYIHYLFRNNLANELLIATNNYIYTSPFMDTITSMPNWALQRLKYSMGTVDIFPQAADGDSNLIYGDGVWWLLAIKEGDYINLDQYYLIDSILADTCIMISGDISDTITDSVDVSYEVLRKLVGDPHIASWNNAAYIADEHSPSFYYPDSNIYWLNCIDSGTVLRNTEADTTYFEEFNVPIRYATTYIENEFYERVYIDDEAVFDSCVSYFNQNYLVFISHRDPWRGLGRKTRQMMDYVGQGYNMIILQGTEYATIWYGDSTGSCWNGRYNSDTLNFIVDTTKYWDTDNLVGNLIVNGKTPLVFCPITINGANRVYFDNNSADTFFIAGDHYYIFEAIPYTNKCADTLLSPRLSHMYFHNNILYGYGYELDSKSDTISTGTIFHSDVGLPKSNIVFYGFDLSLSANDKPTSLFSLNDNLIIGTNNKIYKMIGLPPVLGDGAIRVVIPSIGIPNYNSVVGRDNNYVYIGRRDGFYVFDGISINKISFNIDPLVRQYGSNGYYVGYFRDNIYFGSNDSDHTFIYYEPTKTFTTNTIGLSLFNNQEIMSDSGYFIFAHNGLDPRRLYKFPNSTFYLDSLSPASTDTFRVCYKTGWMSFDDLRYEKAFKDFWLMVTKQYSIDTIFVNFRLDFDSTTFFADTILSFGSSQNSYRVIERIKFPSTTKGRYLQVEMISRNINHFAIGEWGVSWIPVTKNTY